ncbi:helix-turn-helix domain-containing protein [Paracoccus bogoriensis]|uniref:helix-turn-helix domain-containing protein n=1 Tax=Paracoccus bogoriensis TaxID=242065 RepID=UPI001C66BA53|nr:helix-turn-helix domain-containing protein [Paracoccus bogoriensis]MBW7057523.1 helix-turn-helix domain-containing protein [Paracoccus bogoriensis]
MSVQAITWALDYPVHSVTEKVILLVLANYANEYGVSWPSQKTLADQTALGERTVRRVLAAMDARGVIRRIARRRGNGSRQSDMILLAAFEARKPAPPGMIDGEEEPGEPGPSRQPANGDNRPDLPPANRPQWPHPPVTVAALDTSKIRKDSALRDHPLPHLACLAVAGPGLDRSESGPLALSAQEIDRWLEAGCDLIADILPVIAAKTATARSEPIRSWAYFTAAIIARRDRRLTPLNHSGDDTHDAAPPRRKAKQGTSAARDHRDAWDAAVAKANRARSEQADPEA